MDDGVFSGTAAIVVAHPDDEVLWLGGHLDRFAQLGRLIHVTDGAPLDPRFREAAGSPSRPAYARSRRAEMQRAVALAGIHEEQCLCLDVIDRETPFHLEAITRALYELFCAERPEHVLTHAYEGAHMDHDACAFCVREAVSRMERAGLAVPCVLEFAAYHAWAGGFRCFEFLPGEGPPARTLALDAEQRRKKQAMYACFSQPLTAFPIAVERIRRAPVYDFSRRPHEGPLMYETGRAAVPFSEWAARAAAAEAAPPRTEAASGGGGGTEVRDR